MAEKTPEQQAEDQIWLNALGSDPKRDFMERVFKPVAAMVKKEPVHGHRMWMPFDEATFSTEKYDLIEGMWDHEHCAICWERIEEGNAYWMNSQNFILCPTCHGKFQSRGPK
jgi:hypothetical protein